MKNIKKFLKFGFIIAVLLVGQTSFAEGENINLTVKNNGVVVYTDSLTLPGVGMIDVNATDGGPHSVDARSVLNMITVADLASPDFNISNLIYYSSFNAFYLKCITVPDELCDGWQYKVDDVDPGMGMDQEILAGGENVVLFFGDENAEPEPEPTPVPELEPTPPPPEPTSGGGGHSVSGSYARPFISTEVAPTPAPIPPTPPAPLAIVPTQIETPKEIVVPKIVKKSSSQKTVAKINNLAVSTPAAVIQADAVAEILPAPKEKESWIKIVLKWLFGF